MQWLWPCELGPRHPWRSSMVRCPPRQSCAILPFGWRWDEIDEGTASSRPLNLCWPLDISEMLLDDWCSESLSNISCISLVLLFLPIVSF